MDRIEENGCIVIETVTEEGTEWGVSFGGPNPEADLYVEMKDKTSALKLASLVNCMVPSPAR